MKKVLSLAVLFIALLLVTSCGKAKPEEIAAKAAEQYYSYLLDGKYEAFVDGCFQQDTIRDVYRQQLIENAKMFVAQQKAEHNGIKSFEVAGAEVDTAAHTANVFLVLTYGDGGSEQILLPMVEKDELWMMR